MSHSGPNIGPHHLATAIRNRLSKSNAGISAYWMQVNGDRDDYAKKLRAELQGDPVVVLIVRDIGFDNPNSVLAHLIKIMNKNRAACERAAHARTNRMQFGILLLARTQLSVSQASSMVPLPNWFPELGGHYLPIIIEDLTWTTDAPLNSAEVKVEEICERLYELEGVMLERLTSAYEARHDIGNSLMPFIRRGESERYRHLLDTFAVYRKTVNVPSAFRPSRREGRSLIGRLWELVQATAPERLNDPAKALAIAMAMSDDLPWLWQASFASVLRRPTNRDPSHAHRLAGDVLATIASTCQFITVAVHAQDYGYYPVPLLVSYSYDLRRALLDAEMALRT